MVSASVQLIFFSSSFCDPCIQTRAVLDQASRLVPALRIAELDVASNLEEAERAGIRSTPTVVVLDGEGSEVFRAEGAPTLNQVLVALAKAV
ncbi:MAG TPA: thioredoxin family protein [Lacisediminihabitans sp.]|uniref:thioredoxin family protein n=1 Tax=Lacisediminihabitans sp. TaxID=2787631 RepID=UPI002EDA83DC